MKKLLIALFLFLPTIAFAQTQRNPCYYTPTNVPGSGPGGSGCVNVGVSSPLPVGVGGYASGVTPITGNSAGTTGAVVGTLAASTTQKTYICGFNVQTLGGTASSGPITIAGLTGSSQVYQTDVNSATVGKTIASASFTPCIPSSAINTAITITTTAAAGGTAVDVNSWGYQAP